MKKLHFDIISRYDKTYEPVTVGVPFKRGELAGGTEHVLAVVSVLESGAMVSFPAQFHVTASWADGSVKWLLIHALVDLPANKECDYYLTPHTQESMQPYLNVQVRQQKNNIILDNQAVSFYLAEPGAMGLFHKIITPEHVYTAEEITGPVITDENQDDYQVKIDGNGWEILESGPVRALVRARGKHWNEKKEWMDFTVLLSVWAGKPWIQMDYQFINCEADENQDKRKVLTLSNEQAGLKYSTDYPYQNIRKISLSVMPEHTGTQVNHGVYTSSFNCHAKKADEHEALYESATADTIVNTANEMFPEVLFSIFTSDWNCGEIGIAGGIYQAYQNFPKAMESSEKGFVLHLLPEMRTLLKVPQGVARTSRCYLYFHGVELEERMLIDRAHQFEMPPLPIVDTSEYVESQVFESYVWGGYHYATERFLYRYMDSRAKGLGMMHFGDGPEWEYMKQGRSEGKLIWINNEYDMPHNFMVMLARTGDRRYFDYMKAGVEHWYDVDLCHYSEQPYKKGLLYTHSVDHVSGQPVPSHQWVEGFLDYYHVTGNPNGLESARAIGEGLLELIRLPMYQKEATVEPREIGWAMRTFMALYRESGEQRWLEACRPIVDTYIQWAKNFGTWTTPYPDNYMDRVPFMIHVGLVGLYQYYEQCPEQEIKDTILSVIDDMIEHCYIRRIDMFVGKQYPAVRFLNLNGMVLESLAIAYELTGDQKYIEKGLGMFQWITQENQPPVYDFSKYKQDEYTVIYNCPVGPKRSAQTCLPLLHYYGHAMRLGYLHNRGESM